jgi:hypothetical protein
MHVLDMRSTTGCFTTAHCPKMGVPKVIGSRFDGDGNNVAAAAHQGTTSDAGRTSRRRCRQVRPGRNACPRGQRTGGEPSSLIRATAERRDDLNRCLNNVR